MTNKSKVIRPPFPPLLLTRFKHALKMGRPTLKADSHIVFLCGAEPCEESPKGRDTLLKYAKKNLKQFKFFRAEDVFLGLAEEEIIDLITAEKALAQFSDCIIIVVESHGAIAELGAFSMSETALDKKTIVINDACFLKETSFITKGPLAKINRNSVFGPTIYTDLRSIMVAFPEVEKRLKTIEKKYGKSVSFSNFNSILKLSPEMLPHKIRMLFILDIIHLFSPLSYSELIAVLKTVYGDQSFDIHIEIAMLKAIGLIKESEGHYYRSLEDLGLFFHYEYINSLKFRAELVNYYYKYFPFKSKLLGSRASHTT